MTLDPDKLTWAALLGRWVEWSQAALALPDDAQGRAWKRAIPDVIGLQAVTMALGESDRLDPPQRALGLDRARLLIERHTANLHAAMGPSLHPMLVEMIEDAREAVERGEREGGGGVSDAACGV